MNNKIFVNLLSLCRIPLTFIFIVFVHQKKFILSYITFFLIVTSDILDGKIAKNFDLSSDIGAIFDIMSDFFFVSISNYYFFSKDLLPLFIPVIIFCKFFEFCTTSFFIKNNKNTSQIVVYDILGKLSAYIFFLVPIFTLVLNQFFPKLFFDYFIKVIVVILSFLVFPSTFYRIYLVIESWSEK